MSDGRHLSHSRHLSGRRHAAILRRLECGIRGGELVCASIDLNGVLQAAFDLIFGRHGAHAGQHVNQSGQLDLLREEHIQRANEPRERYVARGIAL